jgi:RNA polymerase sigma-70 factor (ECF subfamily)
MNLEELYDLYGEKLYHYLVFRLCSREDAEDVLQETFYRFTRYSVRWKIIRNPMAFVFRVARNEANRFLKRQRNQQVRPEMNPNW